MAYLAFRSCGQSDRLLAFRASRKLLRPSQQFLANANWEQLVVCEQPRDVILWRVKVGHGHLKDGSDLQ